MGTKTIMELAQIKNTTPQDMPAILKQALTKNDTETLKNLVTIGVNVTYSTIAYCNPWLLFTIVTSYWSSSPSKIARVIPVEKWSAKGSPYCGVIFSNSVSSVNKILKLKDDILLMSNFNTLNECYYFLALFLLFKKNDNNSLIEKIKTLKDSTYLNNILTGASFETARFLKDKVSILMDSLFSNKTERVVTENVKLVIFSILISDREADPSLVNKFSELINGKEAIKSIEKTYSAILAPEESTHSFEQIKSEEGYCNDYYIKTIERIVEQSLAKKPSISIALSTSITHIIFSLYPEVYKKYYDYIKRDPISASCLIPQTAPSFITTVTIFSEVKQLYGQNLT